MHVKDLVTSDHRKILSLKEDQTVDDAIRLLTQSAAKALIVTSGLRPVGIFTRSDVMKARMESTDESFANMPIHTVMSTEMITAGSDDKIEGAIDRMLRARVRHLPVDEDGRIVAMLTIEELMASHIEGLQNELEHLNDYIDRLHDSYHD